MRKKFDFRGCVGVKYGMNEYGTYSGTGEGFGSAETPRLKVKERLEKAYSERVTGKIFVQGGDSQDVKPKVGEPTHRPHSGR